MKVDPGFEFGQAMVAKRPMFSRSASKLALILKDQTKNDSTI